MKHKIIFTLVVMTILSMTSCTDNPDQQVIRSFYAEYSDESLTYEKFNRLTQKYWSDTFRDGWVLCSAQTNQMTKDNYDPFFNNNDHTGFCADSIIIKPAGDLEYHVFGSTISDTVILKMNKFHKIDKIRVKQYTSNDTTGIYLFDVML